MTNKKSITASGWPISIKNFKKALTIIKPTTNYGNLINSGCR
jgi:hypothetical protein